MRDALFYLDVVFHDLLVIDLFSSSDITQEFVKNNSLSIKKLVIISVMLSFLFILQAMDLDEFTQLELIVQEMLLKLFAIKVTTTFNSLSSLKLIKRSSFERQFVNCFPPAQATKFASEGFYHGFETPSKPRKKSETEYQSPKTTNVPQYKKAFGVVSHLNVLAIKVSQNCQTFESIKIWSIFIFVFVMPILRKTAEEFITKSMKSIYRFTGKILSWWPHEIRASPIDRDSWMHLCYDSGRFQLMQKQIDVIEKNKIM